MSFKSLKLKFLILLETVIQECSERENIYGNLPKLLIFLPLTVNIS